MPEENVVQSTKTGDNAEVADQEPVESISLQEFKKISDIENNPKVLFERMARDDRLQNRRLSASVSGIATASLTDLTKGGRHKKSLKTRFLVCTLGLVALAMTQMSRMILNVSITQMVIEPAISKSDEASRLASDGSCPWPEDGLALEVESDFSTDSTAESVEITSTVSGEISENTLVDGECSSFSTRSTEETGEEISVLSSNTTVSTTAAPELFLPNENDRFNWSIANQQMLLGSFYYLYFLFMILGGRMAEIYGAKHVLLLGVAGSAIINLLTPWMARNSFVLLLTSRIVMGALQSGIFPALYALINKWLTLSEASIFAPLIKVNQRLGMVMGTLVPGMANGWPNVFYITGCLSVAWSVLWCLVATSDPAESNWVSPEELAHINRKKEILNGSVAMKMSKSSKDAEDSNAEQEEKELDDERTPWIEILTSPSVIGLMFAKLSFSYALDFLAVLSPSYLKYVHHISDSQVSAISTTMFAIPMSLIVFVGWLAKVVVQKRPYGVSKTTIRKIFQGVTTYGSALGLFILTYNDCDIVFVTIILCAIAFLSMFTAGGETMLPYDLSSKYPATIMAIANSVANLSTITTTSLASLILGNRGGSYERWNILLYIFAGANLLGGLVFTLLVKAEPIDLGTKMKSQVKK